ncbi:MAG: glycosyltransferase family 39 protein [Phycisphaerae bacterium]
MPDHDVTAATARATVMQRCVLGAIVVLFGVLSTIGIAWGLPTRGIDTFLFGDDPPWSGERIYRLAGAAEKFAGARGADVDVDPIDTAGGAPVLLTGSDEDIARIYLRYRLYTHQPDEMITMMALRSMRPRAWNFDPKLYQYGGLFLYPVGALIRLAGVVGLIDVRGDVVHYLDHPDAFGKFYVVARGYAAAWGLVGVVVVFGIARRLRDANAGLVAALLFTLMPVVVCMAHEGKPHLPGAVLMLAAVLLAMRHLGRRPAGSCADRRGTGFRDWWLMCVACGASLGMVLSSLPVFVLIPLVAWLDVRRRAPVAGPVPNGGGDHPIGTTDRGAVPCAPGTAWRWLGRTVAGGAVASGVYLATNPYIVINALTHRDVLTSNFGNSLAMYNIARIGAGFVRVLELTIEGATLPVVVLGAAAVVVAAARRRRVVLPLAIPAGVFFVQFVLIGAGKPAEYGRFGVFTNTALAIATACVVATSWARWTWIVRGLVAPGVAIWSAWCGGAYVWNLHVDATPANSRTVCANLIASASQGSAPGAVGVYSEPAPYCCPPMNFARRDVFLLPEHSIPSRATHPSAVAPRSTERRRAGTTIRVLDTLDPNAWRTRTLPRESTPRRALRIRLPTTPISWANKPFELGAFTPPE